MHVGVFHCDNQVLHISIGNENSPRDSVKTGRLYGAAFAINQQFPKISIKMYLIMI